MLERRLKSTVHAKPRISPSEAHGDRKVPALHTPFQRASSAGVLVFDMNADQQRRDAKAAYQRVWREANQEKVVNYRKVNYAVNREKVLASRKVYCAANREKVLATNNAWRAANSERLSDRRKMYYAANREKVLAANKKYIKKRHACDPEFRLTSALRSRVRMAVKSQSVAKSGRTVELLGCSLIRLRRHLESKFTDGMTWKNYGKWEIDHILPCASFNLLDPDQQKQCFHWTNLQPLWKVDNVKKKDKLPASHQPELMLIY